MSDPSRIVDGARHTAARYVTETVVSRPMTACTGTLAASGAVALQLFPEEGREAITAVVVVLFAIGLVAMYAGVRERRRAARLSEHSVTEPGAVTDGAVATRGIARRADELLESPAGEGEVIAYETRTTEVETRWRDEAAARDPRAGADEQERTINRSSSDNAVPFHLEGEAGSVLVDAGDSVRLELTPSETITEELGPSDHHLVVDTERTKRISLLEEGDEVFVFGRVRGSADRADAVVGPDDELGELIVSTNGRDALVDQHASNAPVAMALGAVVAASSLGVLVYEYLLA